MLLYRDLPIYKALYDLALEIFCFLKKDFDRKYKYKAGINLKKETVILRNP
jgi:hypothetical protein